MSDQKSAKEQSCCNAEVAFTQRHDVESMSIQRLLDFFFCYGDYEMHRIYV